MDMDDVRLFRVIAVLSAVTVLAALFGLGRSLLDGTPKRGSVLLGGVALLTCGGSHWLWVERTEQVMENRPSRRSTG